MARVLFGPLKVPAAHDGHGDSHAVHGPPAKNDINGREIAILVPIALCCLALGVPAWIMRTMSGPLEQLQSPPPAENVAVDRDRSRDTGVLARAGDARTAETAVSR
jgi:hypothetical protein